MYLNNNISKPTVLILLLFGFLSFFNDLTSIGVLIYVLSFCAFFYSTFVKKPFFFTNFIFTIIPIIMIYRDFSLPYSFPSYLLIANIFQFIAIEPGYLKLKNRSSIMTIIFILIYIIIGIIQGKEITTFVKHIELFLSIYVFTIFLKRKKINLFYYNMLLIFLCFSLFQFIDTRYVLNDTTNNFKVNPNLLSNLLLLPISYLISTKNSNYIVFNKKYTKLFLLFSIVSLLFSTSRTGFFVLLILLLFVTKFDSFKKTFYVLSTLSIIVLSIYYLTPIANIIDLWYNKTFSHANGLSGASTGRLDQWVMTYNYIFDIDFFSLLLGYGPSSGYVFTGVYSKTIPSSYLFYGKQIQLHSLYLNIFVEYGMLAFIAFCFWLTKTFNAVKIYRIKYKDSFHSLLLISFLSVSLSASSVNILFGFIISLILTSNNYYATNK